MADQNELLSQYIQVRTLHNTKRVVSPYSIFPRKEEKLRICESRKQRRSQADSRPTSSGQKATFSSLRPTASLQNQTYVSSHIHVHFPWHRLATGPRCHSHSRRMCTTKSRPPASAVSPKPVYFCVGGTTASSEAGHIFQRRNLASFPWRWPPRRVSVVPFQGSHLTLPIHSPSQDEKFLPAQEPFPPHPPYRNKTNPLPSRYTNPPNMQGTRQPAPLPQPFPSQAGIVPSFSPPTTASNPENSDPGPDSGSHQDSFTRSNTSTNTQNQPDPPCQTPSKHQVTGTSQANPSQPKPSTHARRQVTSRLSPLPHPARHAHGDRDTDGRVHTRTGTVVCGLVTRQTGRADGQTRDGGPLVAGRCRRDSVLRLRFVGGAVTAAGVCLFGGLG